MRFVQLKFIIEPNQIFIHFRKVLLWNGYFFCLATLLRRHSISRILFWCAEHIELH